MRHFFLAALLVCGTGTAALACTCIALPSDAAERRSIVNDVADGAVALVEVELESPYDASRGGERLRVVSTLAGEVPAIIDVEREGPPDGARCDVVLARGDRVPVLLYPARQGGGSRYRLADRCLTQLLADPTFRSELTAAVRSATQPARGAAL